MSDTSLCAYSPSCTDGRAVIVYGKPRRRRGCINRSLRCQTCGARGEASTTAASKGPR